MDTSKEYILMCEKAEEIQSLWKPQVGDWIFMPNVFDKNKNHPCTCLSGFTEIVDYRNFEVLAYWRCYMLADEDAQSIFLKGKDFFVSNWKKHIFELENNIKWLPRQDQLQNIFIKDHKELGSDIAGVGSSVIDGLLYYFERFIDYIDGNIYDNLFSMEQLWLAFVMCEKFNKFWNEEDWIEKK